MPWHTARPCVKVKLLASDGETYVLAQSEDRIVKERSMRRRRLRKYLKTLADLIARKRPLKRDELHQALGAAKKEAGRDARHVKVQVTHHGENESKIQTAALTYQPDRHTLRITRRREGRYPLRANLTDTDPVKMWEHYLQLTEIEQAFKELKGDLFIRPIHHQLEERIKAHIFISFLSYCLQGTLKARLKRTASGLTPCGVLEKFATMQLLDVHLPTTDGREIVLTRYTQPEKDLQILLHPLQLTMPEQAPPKIQAPLTPSK